MLRPPLAAIAVLSAAALAYEVLLLRLFAIVQWHHFAYLSISVALLGIGAAGTFVTVARRRLQAAFPASFVAAAASFAVAALACFAAAERVPFNALEIGWNPHEFLGLAAIYLLLFIPFFCAATALCIAYASFAGQSPRLYAADTLGAGLGSIGLLAALFVLHPAAALRAIFALGLAAAALASWPVMRRTATALACAALVAPWLLPPAALELVASDYKDLRQSLRVKGTRIVAERSGPLGVVTAVESPLAPLRHAPGLSLAASAGPPAQIGLFIDGQAAGAVTRFDGDLAPLACLGDTTSALPYALLARPRVLVLGAGAGSDILQALLHGARAVDAVELDSEIVGMVQQDLGDFSGRPYARPGVNLHVAEARSFVAASRERYDLIQVALLDAFGSSAAGLGSLGENPLYTIEAFDAYLDRLAPGGLLALTRWVSLPPRDSLRLFATAVAALKQRGLAEPGHSLALVRGWSTATLLVKNGAFSPGEIAAIRDFSRKLAFDTAYYPGVAAGETNIFNVLERDDFFAATEALLGDHSTAFLVSYKFDLTPITDDRPYFFHFFKWRTLPEFWQLRAQHVLPPLDWGYPVLVLALLQATVISALLILLPLAVTDTRHAFATAPARLRRRVPAYFFVLGLGFMAIEIPFLQRFTLFLGHPATAAAVVRAAFLACASLGARFAARVPASARWPFALVAAIASLYAFTLPPLLGAAMGLALGWKMLLTLAIVAPLAFCLGIPFPLGLATLAAARAEALIPWAWGINGFASVIAALAATLAAIHSGQRAVMLLAATLYLLAAWQSPGRHGPE